ncbi:MAG: hypothetical protein RJA35_827 [Actinomycetota bacterium]|jgi:transcriptional regulator with XRE-family HTH domain
MDLRKDISDFLTSRRARISPESVGLPSYSPNRRVAGLRREEVAMLAGVSVDYYTRIERGQLKGVSESVVAGLARVLNLDDAERKYLDNLVSLSNPGIRLPSKPRPMVVKSSLLRLLESVEDVPMYVRNGRMDILAMNAMAKQFLSPVIASQGPQPNMARFCILDPSAQDYFVDWEKVATDTVGILRAQASRDPYDKQLTDLIGELCTLSEFFRVHWAAHNVHEHKGGTKRFNHPEVGQMELMFEAFDVPNEESLRLNTYFAPAGSASENALKLLRISAYESRTQTDAALES